MSGATPSAARALAALATTAAIALSGCGSGGGGSNTTTTATTADAAQVARGKELFAQRCAGCHTLSAAGTRGSATDVHRAERTDGVNFDQRSVNDADVLFAIRNGGFGSTIMPRNIVVGDDAKAVAAFLAKTSGAKATSSPDAALQGANVRKMRAPAQDVSPRPPAATGSPTDTAFLRLTFESSVDMWQRQFQAAGASFRAPHLVFFHTEIHTPCGRQTAKTGPFYCPQGYGVFLNTDFFGALAQAYGLHSGFAAGYIVAHEVGHHVQQLLGVLQRVAQADEQDPAGANRRSIAIELQADCYAGVWLHEIAPSLTDQDIEQILRTAAVVGDDYQRNRAGADLAPETWTHGSSAQRVRWLTVGKESGAPAACDTFTVSTP